MQVGDIVYIEKSAQIDVCTLSWAFISSHPQATVKGILRSDDPLLVHESLVNLEWKQAFPGGNTCQGVCAEGRGQQITQKHLSLCFEASREVNTVPMPKRECTEQEINQLLFDEQHGSTEIETEAHSAQG